MRIGDSVFVHGYVDEIRKDCVIIRNKGGYFGTAPSEVIETINEPPSAEVVHKPDYSYEADMVRRLKEALSAEAVQGEWIFNPKDAIESMFMKPKCSKCGFESSDGGNFCPNCGARMKGADDDD